MFDPIWTNGIVDLYQGDCREVLQRLPAQSFHCIVTSPPYWGLRDYGTEPSIWYPGGLVNDCAHDWGGLGPKHHPGQVPQTKVGANTRESSSAAGQNAGSGQFCRHCGAWLGNLGLEPTPELYVEHLVEIFQAVKRVLRDDGTMWLNLGDSYASSWASGRQSKIGNPSRTNRRIAMGDGLKEKDLVGIPWRVAFALQADGWYLRSDIIWQKPNPMPESVTDRPSKSHEYLFLLSKNEKYFYDIDAIREPLSEGTITRYKGSEWWDRPNFDVKHGGNNDRGDRGQPPHSGNALGRNKRTVWTIATYPFPEAHFATFPEKLVEPCILAGSPKDGTVLDPFIGSGTTAVAAQRLGRRCIGIDASEAYLKDIAVKRITGVSLPMQLDS